MPDLLISDARIVDGSGRRPFWGSVVVTGDRIEGIIRSGAAEPLTQVRNQIVELHPNHLVIGHSSLVIRHSCYRRCPSRGTRGAND